MNFKKEAFSGAKWTTLGTIVLAVTGLLKISVLARFLDKEDFGLMALVTLVLGFMNLFMDMGLTSAILNKQDITKNEYSSLYWINIFFSLFLFGLIILLSPMIADFYDEPKLWSLVPLMSTSILISGFGKQFRIIEQKELNFRFISLTDIVSSIFGLITGIILAVLDYGVLALIFGALAQFTISNSIFFVKGISSKGMEFHFRWSETKPFLSIGIYQVGGQILNYFSRDLDILLIGKFFGTEILGGYSLAKQLIRRPLQIINPIVTKVGISILPRFQKNNFALRTQFTKLFYGLGSLNAFVYGIAAIFAPYLVVIFYGSDFMSIVPFVQLFSVVIYLRSMAGNVSILVITKGRTDYEFYWNALTTFIMPAAIFLGSFHSIEMIIIFMGITQFILLIPSWFIFFKKLINLEFWPFFKAHVFPLGISGLFFVFHHLFISGFNLYSDIITAICMVFSFGLYSYFAIEDIKIFINKFKTKYARI